MLKKLIKVITGNKKTRQDLANPYRHIPYGEVLEKVGAVDLRDNYWVEDLGNGYSRIYAINESRKWTAEKWNEHVKRIEELIF